MSVYSDSLTESRPPTEGPDLFDDEEKTDGLLKSLVQCNGLQKSWGFILKKIEKLEKKQQKHGSDIKHLLSDYVPRAEYHQVVEVEHGDKLTQYGDNLSKLNKLTDEHQSTLDGHETRLVNHEQRVVGLEATADQHGEELKAMEDRSAARHEEITARLNHVSAEIHKQMDKNYQDYLNTKADHEKRFEEVAEAAAESEKRMSEFVNGEVEKLKEMVSIDYISEIKMLDQQVLIKQMVRDEMITPLRGDLESTDQRHLDLARQVDIQTNDLHRLLRNLDQRCTDTNNKFTKVTADIMDEVEIRAKRSELETTASNLRSEMQTVSQEIESLKDRVCAKLNEFVDHFTKVQETIDDHEHCLRHHAEELENRATKYDLLVQQNRIDRCCLKEEIDEEFSELKQVVEWQTDKIENFALTTAMMGGGGKSGKRKSVAASKRISAAASPSPTDGEKDGEKSASMRKVESPSTETQIDEGEDDEGDELGIVFLVRSQLESLALGVVGLAHSTLREPNLGESRQQRLMREKELLELLGATRHWITHKTAPGGWDPGKLLSVGLQCAHPVENGPRANLPQIPKSLMQPDGDDAKDKASGDAGSKGTFVRSGRSLVETPREALGGVVPKPPVKDAKAVAANNAPGREGTKHQGLAGLKGGLSGNAQDLNKLEGLPMLKV
jgi:chromosome segregation ATPase